MIYAMVASGQCGGFLPQSLAVSSDWNIMRPICDARAKGSVWDGRTARRVERGGFSAEESYAAAISLLERVCQLGLAPFTVYAITRRPSGHDGSELDRPGLYLSNWFVCYAASLVDSSSVRASGSSAALFTRCLATAPAIASATGTGTAFPTCS